MLALQSKRGDSVVRSPLCCAAAMHLEAVLDKHVVAAVILRQHWGSGLQVRALPREAGDAQHSSCGSCGNADIPGHPAHSCSTPI
jgi:hypothetical protein